MTSEASVLESRNLFPAVYTIRPVVKGCDNRFDNELYRVNGAFEFWEITDNISETVEDRYTVPMKD